MIKTRWLRLVRVLGLAQALLRGWRPGVTECQLQGGKHSCPVRLMWAGKLCWRYLSLEELLLPPTFRGSLGVWSTPAALPGDFGCPHAVLGDVPDSLESELCYGSTTADENLRGLSHLALGCCWEAACWIPDLIKNSFWRRYPFLARWQHRVWW